MIDIEKVYENFVAAYERMSPAEREKFCVGTGFILDQKETVSTTSTVCSDSEEIAELIKDFQYKPELTEEVLKKYEGIVSGK